MAYTGLEPMMAGANVALHREITLNDIRLGIIVTTSIT